MYQIIGPAFSCINTCIQTTRLYSIYFQMTQKLRPSLLSVISSFVVFTSFAFHDTCIHFANLLHEAYTILLYPHNHIYPNKHCTLYIYWLFQLHHSLMLMLHIVRNTKIRCLNSRTKITKVDAKSPINRRLVANQYRHTPFIALFV